MAAEGRRALCREGGGEEESRVSDWRRGTGQTGRRNGPPNSSNPPDSRSPTPTTTTLVSPPTRTRRRREVLQKHLYVRWFPSSSSVGLLPDVVSPHLHLQEEAADKSTLVRSNEPFSASGAMDRLCGRWVGRSVGPGRADRAAAARTGPRDDARKVRELSSVDARPRKNRLCAPNSTFHSIQIKLISRIVPHSQERMKSVPGLALSSSPHPSSGTSNLEPPLCVLSTLNLARRCIRIEAMLTITWKGGPFQLRIKSTAGTKWRSEKARAPPSAAADGGGARCHPRLE
jgi:hypothetical protein